jgi:ribosomal 50S subunit-recycling heat shock protein
MVFDMRIDKFLKNARLIKRRTIAKEACEQGRVFLNDRPAKPGAEVKLGDTVRIRFGNGEINARVTALTESARKEDAAFMYEVIP